MLNDDNIAKRNESRILFIGMVLEFVDCRAYMIVFKYVWLYAFKDIEIILFRITLNIHILRV
jgi:hypothetical protein